METLGGRYQLEKLLGEGGMASVYKAQDLLLERPVAVKVLREQWAADTDFIARFRQEARSAASLSHPNIVAVYDVGEDAGRHYIVMEFIAGPSLKEEIASGPLSSQRVIEIGGQVCAGLEYAHQKGVIHRDIKPHNILLHEQQAKITDFGIARALGTATQTGRGEVFGSPLYLSPEQINGESATAASDIYSLGVTLYEASTGRLPFQADSPIATALKHVNEAPPMPREIVGSIPPSLEGIILRAMSKDPRKRFASAAQMGLALSVSLSRSQEDTAPLRAAPPPPPVFPPVASGPVPTGPVPQAAPVFQRRPRKGFPWVPFAAALALLLLVTGLVFASPRLVQRLVGPVPAPAAPATTPTAAAAVSPTAAPTAAPSPSPTITPTVVPSPTPTAVPQILVPGVTSMLPQDARILIEGQGLVYREGPREFSPDVPDGRIVRQAPAAGTAVRPGGAVTVTVSRGPETVRVPEVRDVPLTVAEARLNDAGLNHDVKEVFSSTIREGLVIQQEPAPGATVNRGTTVTLTVSKGRERVAVPNVVGQAEDKAQKAIQQAGLRNYPFVNFQGHDQLPDNVLRRVCVGCVLSTTPAPGEMVELGTEIRMAVRKD